MHAEKAGKLLGKQDLVGVPFGGGISELPYLNCRQILLNDVHKDLFNLYWAITRHEQSFMREVDEAIYHPASLENAKRCLSLSDHSYDRAVAFFIVNWMTRCSGGTEKEFQGKLAMRFTASGGSSIARWRSAVAGVPEWAGLIRNRCECTCLDWREFATKWNDRKGHGLYLDPPWIGVGDDYLHKFTNDDHGLLAQWCATQRQTTIVIRHSDCEAYRAYYTPERGWEWHTVDAKNQAGNKTGEVLIVRRGSKS